MRPSVWTVFSPFRFTKIFKPLKSWRNRGIPIAIFLDDGLGGGAHPVSAKVNSLVVHSDLLKSSFVLNEESQWVPIQIITLFGVILNTVDSSIKTTDELIAKLSHGLEILSTHEQPMRVHIKCVASIAGQIISPFEAVWVLLHVL